MTRSVGDIRVGVYGCAHVCMFLQGGVGGAAFLLFSSLFTYDILTKTTKPNQTIQAEQVFDWVLESDLDMEFDLLESEGLGE